MYSLQYIGYLPCLLASWLFHKKKFPASDSLKHFKNSTREMFANCVLYANVYDLVTFSERLEIFDDPNFHLDY